MDNYLEILREIFPNRPEDQIEDVIQMVQENGESEENLEFMVSMLSESGNSTLDQAAGFGHNQGNRCDMIFAQLSDMIPDADPDYLRKESELLAEKSCDDLHHFILEAIDSNKYPTKREYLMRQRTIDEIRKFTRNFSVEEFLEVIPNPVEYFCSSSFKSALSDDGISELDEVYALRCLTNLFPYLREKDISKVFQRKKNLIQASDVLARIPRHFRIPRQPLDIGEDCENVQLLQEIAFIENKNKLKIAMKMKNEQYRLSREEAEKYGLLETCQCCYFESLLPEECFFCKKGCPFCKECVQKGVEHEFGKGELHFSCLANCNSEFDISTLKMVLNRKTFDPLFTKIQMEEVKNANIDGLETCPYCDFSIILSSEEKIFKCQNIDCMEETCRQCRHKSHVPFKCNEIEYDEDVKRRTYIENRMTEALIRTCWKCQKSFLKESGCNKMTCPCGARMCYYCGAKDISYDHFGEISRNKCPLYTQDLKKFHADRVIKSAEKAKEELGLHQNPELLKIDPSEGIEAYFQAL